MDDLVKALEEECDILEKIVNGKDIYIEVLEEENKELRKEIKELKGKLYKAERSKPIWETGL